MKPALRVVLPAAGAALAMAGGAALVCAGGQCIVPAVDAAGLSLAHGWRTAWLDGLAASITWGGSLFVLVPLALLFAALDARRRGWKVASFVPLALMASAALAHLAKYRRVAPAPGTFPAADDHACRRQLSQRARDAGHGPGARVLAAAGSPPGSRCVAGRRRIGLCSSACPASTCRCTFRAT
jgi:hypothetical protein